MSNRISCLLVLAVSSLLPVSAAFATPEDKKDLPSVSFSIANQTGEEGPLYQKAMAVFDLADQGDKQKFDSQFKTDAERTVRQADATQAAFTSEFVSAALESCMGPYAYDEGSWWVQFSWICRNDPAAPIAEFLTFKHSPEVNVTIWFEDDKIAAVAAGESIPSPLGRMVSMNAVPATWVRDDGL